MSELSEYRVDIRIYIKKQMNEVNEKKIQTLITNLDFVRCRFG